MEGGLWAWEALQHMLKMAVEDPDLLKVWAQIKCQDIDSDKGCNFIVGDGCVHFLYTIKTVESLEWRQLPLRG
jgi:hypothetical protein